MWLAIDPSFRNTGMAIMAGDRIISVGLIQTKKGPPPVYLDSHRCILELHRGLLAFSAGWLDELGYRIPVYAEAKGGSKSAQAATQMAMSQAVLATTFANSTVLLMLPQKVKQILCGDRSATKDDVKYQVQKLYPEAEDIISEEVGKSKARQEHIYDAIAIGWAINQERQRA